MASLRQIYYDLFPKVYDLVIRLHSRDTEGSLRRYLTEKANLSKGERALDLCTGTGSVAIELAKRVEGEGLVVGLDFSRGMLGKAQQKAKGQHLKHFYPIQGNASRLPFKNSSFDGVTCSHAFYELKESERMMAIEEVARVLKEGGRFCLMEHAIPKKFVTKFFFYIRLLFLGSSDAKRFLMEEEAVLGKKFKNIVGELSPTGQSKLIYGEKKGFSC